MSGSRPGEAPPMSQEAGEIRQGRRMTQDRTAPTPHGNDPWFDAQLGRLYADVVNEPLPPEFLRLVEQLKKVTSGM